MTITPVRPNEEAASDSSIQALIEEARQHRRRRLAIWLVAAVVIVGASAGIVAGHDSGGGSLARVALRPGVPNPAFTGPFSKTQSELLDYVLPTSGADQQAAAKFSLQVQGLLTEDKAACMDRAGYDSAVTYTKGSLVGSNNTEFPPIAELAAKGFELRAVNFPYFGVAYVGKPLSGTAITNHIAARTNCFASAQSPWNALVKQSEPLANAWQEQVIPQINRTSAFKKALVGFSICVRRGGVDATTIDGYFNAISRLRGPIGPRTSTSKLAAGYLRYGKLYATCLAPAEAIRDSLRVRARTIFEQQHATQIADLATGLRQIVG